jgi:hypothetical protein
MVMERRLKAVNAGVSQVLKSLGCKHPPSAANATCSAASTISSDQMQQQQQQQQQVLMQALGQLEGRARSIVTVWSTAVGKTSSRLPLPGASQPVLRRQGSISASKEESHVSAKAGPATVSSRSQALPEPHKHSRAGARMEAAAFSSRPRSPGKKFGNKLFNDSGSDSEDEAPLTRDQIQSMRMAAGTSGL